ncbi:hypothetical protein FB570_109140 [Streptomyces sp. T12]|uniref:hypothetical protein n=1 Tax=Streptomyces sp. T12 TaxID=477697 RepID=UPI0011A9736D|nr:hypothetical protein [Streptomyces sp. T12]TWD18702.1 hypothetical protein FB570_109140 [Streptomyces sp. T12]
MTADPARTATVEGVWDLTIATPVGRITAAVAFRRGDDTLVGVASGAGEDVPLRDIAVDGAQVTWKQSVTKPLRLSLAFAVHIEGDTLQGISRAGRLPASKVTGTRRTTPARVAE